MIRTKFAQIVDTAILSIAVALLGYAWIIRFTKNIPISIILSGFISFIVAKIMWKITKKQTNKHNLKQSEMIFAENCINYFSKHPAKCFDFFINLLEARKLNSNCVIKDDEAYYIDYLSETLTFSNIVKTQEIVAKHKINKIYFLCHKPTEKAKLLIDSNSIVYLDYDDVFMLMKNKNEFPIENTKTAKTRKFDLKNSIISLINRKKAKHYFGYGILLLLLSFVIPFTFWYVVMGTIFILLATISLFTKQKVLS